MEWLAEFWSLIKDSEHWDSSRLWNKGKAEGILGTTT